MTNGFEQRNRRVLTCSFGKLVIFAHRQVNLDGDVILDGEVLNR